MKTPIRVGAFAFALATGAALFVPLAAPASAALKSSVSCAKEGSALKNGVATSTFASCTPASLKLGGTGLSPKTPPPGTKKGQLALTITWKGGMGKTTVAFGFVTTTLGKCKAPTTRVIATGSVKSATGKVAKITKKGEPVSALVCVHATPGDPKLGSSAVEPGTKFKL